MVFGEIALKFGNGRVVADQPFADLDRPAVRLQRLGRIARVAHMMPMLLWILARSLW